MEIDLKQQGVEKSTRASACRSGQEPADHGVDGQLDGILSRTLEITGREDIGDLFLVHVLASGEPDSA